jgi:hypothetical protein
MPAEPDDRLRDREPADWWPDGTTHGPDAPEAKD